jgi:hypothetical protein
MIERPFVLLTVAGSNLRPDDSGTEQPASSTGLPLWGYTMRIGAHAERWQEARG